MLGAVVFASISLAACGSPNSPEQPAVPNSPETPETPATKDPIVYENNGVTVTIDNFTENSFHISWEITSSLYSGSCQIKVADYTDGENPFTFMKTTTFTGSETTIENAVKGHVYRVSFTATDKKGSYLANFKFNDFTL